MSSIENCLSVGCFSGDRYTMHISNYDYDHRKMHETPSSFGKPFAVDANDAKHLIKW